METALLAPHQPEDGLTLGERIHLIRRRLDLSLLALSRLTGIPDSSLSRYERGETQPPADVLAHLAVALGVTPDVLLGFEATRMWFNGRTQASQA